MQPTPRNKLYMTREDFPSYSDEIARVYRQLHPKEENKEDDMLCKDVTFCVTEACNLACTYCYECHKTSRRMSWETAKQIVDGLFEGEFVDNTAPAIILDFIGGEPLLEIELIDKTVEYFKRKAFQLRHPWAYYYINLDFHQRRALRGRAGAGIYPQKLRPPFHRNQHRWG